MGSAARPSPTGAWHCTGPGLCSITTNWSISECPERMPRPSRLPLIHQIFPISAPGNATFQNGSTGSAVLIVFGPAAIFRVMRLRPASTLHSHTVKQCHPCARKSRMFRLSRRTLCSILPVQPTAVADQTDLAGYRIHVWIRRIKAFRHEPEPLPMTARSV
jgi:hypothetical protein